MLKFNSNVKIIIYFFPERKGKKGKGNEFKLILECGHREQLFFGVANKSLSPKCFSRIDDRTKFLKRLIEGVN